MSGMPLRQLSRLVRQVAWGRLPPSRCIFDGYGNARGWQLPHYPVYLSIVPMFHCNGWGHPWSLVFGGNGFHAFIVARKHYRGIEMHHVTYMGAAPIILQMATEYERGHAKPFDPPINTGQRCPATALCVGEMSHNGS